MREHGGGSRESGREVLHLCKEGGGAGGVSDRRTTTRKVWPGDEESWSPSQPLAERPSVLSHCLGAAHGTCGLHGNLVAGPGGGIWVDSQLCSHSRSLEWHPGYGKSRFTIMNT